MTYISNDFLRWSQKINDKSIKPNPLSKDSSGYNPEELESLQNEIIENKDCGLAYYFITEFSYKPHRMHKVIIDKKDAKYSYMILKYINNIDVKKFKKIILESSRPRYLFELAKHLTILTDIEQVESLIIKSNSFTYMRLFAEKISKANIERIEQAVLDSGDSAEIKKFAKYVSKSKMKQFLLVV